jgi:hypothetical protein
MFRLLGTANISIDAGSLFNVKFKKALIHLANFISNVLTNNSK